MLNLYFIPTGNRLRVSIENNVFCLFCRYLSYTLVPTMIRKQDATFIITSVASNREGHNLAWDFVQEHWQYMYTQ